MKKLISLVLAIMMVAVVGLAFADDDPTNNLTLDASISIKGLTAGDVVNFYQVLEFDATASQGWKKTADFASLDDAIVTAILNTGITAATAGTVGGMVPATPTAAHYNATVAEDATSVTVNNPIAGLYVAIITPADSDTVYNPVFVGADYYSKNNSGEWTVTGDMSYSNKAMVKKDTVTIEKTATEYTHDSGEIVSFTVTTKIPMFGDNYTNPMFKINDTLSTGLEVFIDDEHPFTVTPADASFNGKPASGAHSFTLDFTSTYLSGLTATTDVKVTYFAKVTNKAPYNVNVETNDVTVQFSNNPSNENDYALLKDRTNHYTFSLDADIFGHEDYEGSELIKTGVDAEGNDIVTEIKYDNGHKDFALQGAHFKLTTDLAGNDVYSNGTSINFGDLVSDAEGKFNIKGLDDGVYYFRETAAPEGFVKNNSVYKIEVIADTHLTEYTVNETDSSTGKDVAVTYKTTVLDSYEIKISELDADGNVKAGTTVTSSFTLNNDADSKRTSASSTGDQTKPIENTPGVELPSTGGIGTTIFYIVGGLLLVGAAIVLVARRKAHE
jgi:LPXTG-motif cell wall-anchored protein